MTAARSTPLSSATQHHTADKFGWANSSCESVGAVLGRCGKSEHLREAWQAWIAGATVGTIRNRSGDPFKPAALRAYRSAMKNRVLPELGPARLADLRRPQIQDLADAMVTEGLEPLVRALRDLLTGSRRTPAATPSPR